MRHHRRSNSLLTVLLVCVLRRSYAFSPSSVVSPSARQLLRHRPTGPLSASSEALPFIIDKLPQEPQDSVFREITDVCIPAFFNDGEPGQKIPFWKELQLAYLRNLQHADLKRRRRVNPKSNFMLVARQVHPLSENPDAVRKTPLIMDPSAVYNLAPRSGEDYVRGKVLGFVEVTKRPYGLGDEQVGFDEKSRINLRKASFYTKRPVLTNLSVSYQARKSGIGSKLVQACERKVQEDWQLNEIVLEVEDDNDSALQFYERRGYKVLFEDTASRRYDTNGLWLRQIRCRRKVMRKMLNIPSLLADTSNVFGLGLLRRLRERITA